MRYNIHKKGYGNSEGEGFAGWMGKDGNMVEVRDQRFDSDSGLDTHFTVAEDICEELYYDEFSKEPYRADDILYNHGWVKYFDNAVWVWNKLTNAQVDVLWDMWSKGGMKKIGVCGVYGAGEEMSLKKFVEEYRDKAICGDIDKALDDLFDKGVEDWDKTENGYKEFIEGPVLSGNALIVDNDGSWTWEFEDNNGGDINESTGRFNTEEDAWWDFTEWYSNKIGNTIQESIDNYSPSIADELDKLSLWTKINNRTEQGYTTKIKEGDMEGCVVSITSMSSGKYWNWGITLPDGERIDGERSSSTPEEALDDFIVRVDNGDVTQSQEYDYGYDYGDEDGEDEEDDNYNPFDNGYAGWISPEGDLYETRESRVDMGIAGETHTDKAKEICNKLYPAWKNSKVQADEYLYKQGWAKYFDIAVWFYKNLTNKQIDVLYDKWEGEGTKHIGVRDYDSMKQDDMDLDEFIDKYRDKGITANINKSNRNNRKGLGMGRLSKDEIIRDDGVDDNYEDETLEERIDSYVDAALQETAFEIKECASDIDSCLYKIERSVRRIWGRGAFAGFPDAKSGYLDMKGGEGEEEYLRIMSIAKKMEDFSDWLKETKDEMDGLMRG